MKFNQATDYAIRAVLYMSRLPKGQITEAKIISEEEHIPMRFLLKILRLLTKAGLVESYRGINGGYTLAKLPEEITLLDVVEAMEGPIYINRCLYSPEECSKNFSAHCPVHEVFFELQSLITKKLSQYNFKMLRERVK